MHLLKSTASSIRAGRAAQHSNHWICQYAFGCACGLLADALSIEDALILDADPSNAVVPETRLWARLYGLRFVLKHKRATGRVYTPNPYSRLGTRCALDH